MYSRETRETYSMREREKVTTNQSRIEMNGGNDYGTNKKKERIVIRKRDVLMY